MSPARPGNEKAPAADRGGQVLLRRSAEAYGRFSTDTVLGGVPPRSAIESYSTCFT
jgi:hypothetical protein